MDLFGDPAERDPFSPFVRMLWERFTAHEEAMTSGVGSPFVDLSMDRGSEKEQRTTEAVARGEPLIYSGQIRPDDLFGEPDVLRRIPTP